VGFRPSVLEHLIIEVLELAENALAITKRSEFRPVSHIVLAVRNDEELNRLLSNIIIAFAGVDTHIHEVSWDRESKEGNKHSIVVRRCLQFAIVVIVMIVATLIQWI
jgi:histone H2A